MRSSMAQRPRATTPISSARSTPGTRSSSIAPDCTASMATASSVSGRMSIRPRTNVNTTARTAAPTPATRKKTRRSVVAISSTPERLVSSRSAP